MTDYKASHAFLSYSDENQDFVESLARQLRGDARLTFWFAPWHSIPGVPIQEQMEDALEQADSCAVFISDPKQIRGWQNEQMQAAIMARVEDETNYRVIPVLLPGVTRPKRRELPRFLRLYEAVEFRSAEDEQAIKYLLSGILGIPPIDVDGFIQAKTRKEQVAVSSTKIFDQGHAVVIGVANYPAINPLPEIVLNDAHDISTLLTDPDISGYPPKNVVQLLEDKATKDGICSALEDLACRTSIDDTAIVFFSGHGGRIHTEENEQQFILPYDCNLDDLSGTAITSDEMTAMLQKIQAERLLVLFDSCHSGGAGNPKDPLTQFKSGLNDNYYQMLAQGKGRVVIASSRATEASWTIEGMNNSIFTHYLLEALRGHGKTLEDGYVRVFDIFRHVARYVPDKASQIGTSQHPIFKAMDMELDFPIALIKS